LSRIKTLNGPRVRGISPVGKEKVYGGKDLLKSQVLSSEWNTEQVREDASGDSEDGEDDELPCVIGESEFPRAGETPWIVGFLRALQTCKFSRVVCERRQNHRQEAPLPRRAQRVRRA